jgi:GT2 family glycosyltransferase
LSAAGGPDPFAGGPGGRVVAVVVCHNGRPFIRETLRGLSRQTHPIDDLLVVDTGSRDGTTEWVRSHLGGDSVLPVRGQFGRAVNIALRHPRVASADWLWLLHDDCAPEPEALQHLLSEAAYTPAAAVLGPKLVGWNDPGQLQEIGWWIDRAAYASSPVEEREIDQGQHDQLSEVFFVSTAGMFVRRAALEAVRGFDSRMPAFRDDLDLCWRVHLVGGKVLVVPSAKVRHFRAASVGSRLSRSVTRRRYLTERHSLAALLKMTAARRLPAALLATILATAIRVLGLVLTGRLGEASQVFFAWGWNIKELPVTLRLRRHVQARRVVTDQSLTRLRAPGGQRVRSLARALTETVVTDPGGTHASTRGFKQILQRTITRHPVAAMFALFAVIMAVSLRAVLVSGAIGGGELAAFPDSARELMRGFVSAIGTEGLGSSLPSSPSLLVYGLAAVVAFGKGLLAQKLLLWLALPLAAVTCTRALRLLVPNLHARALAGLLYATSPLATAALGQGRVGELAFLVLAPAVMAQLWLGLEAEQPRERWRPALRFALLTALSIAMYPPALVIVGVLAVIAGVTAVVLQGADQRLAVAKRFGLLAAGFAGAIVLLLPWSLVLFSAASPLAAVGAPLVTPSFLDLVQLRPGGPGQPIVIGPLYPALALAGVIFAAGARRLLTFALGLALLVNALLVAWQAGGAGPSITDWPGGLLIPGAVAWAAIAGIGFSTVLPALSRARHGTERAAATFLTVLTALGGLLITGNLLRGDWAIDSSPDELPATVVASPARVLWLSDRPGGGVYWTVTGPTGRTLLDDTRPSAPSATRAVEGIVTDVMEARTHRAGTLLQMMNIGYVVVRPGPEAGRTTELLARQGDLEAQVTDQAGLFAGPAAAPGGLVVPGAAPASPQELLASSATPVPLRGSVPHPTGRVEGPATVLLPMPADSGWRATAGGSELEQATAFGWGQAFRVPDAVSGELAVDYKGQRTRTFALLGELILIFLGLAFLVRPTKRPPPPAPVSDEVTGELRLPAAAMGRAR